MIPHVYHEREKFEEHYTRIERRLNRLEETVACPTVYMPSQAYPSRKDQKNEKSKE